MPHEVVNPESLGAPRGYSNGILAAKGRLLFVAGQIAWDGTRVVAEDFVAQFGKALDNALAVVEAAGGGPASVARLTMYVTDKREYLGALPAVGAAYRARMGRHFPAMALVEVSALVEPAAKIEIEATAVIEDRDD